ncbi:MAG: DUF2779 domain-containing protein [DPANN group archaeon]|nr:DUF2779 domain-containing protein [DPANN group archaeon]
MAVKPPEHITISKTNFLIGLSCPRYLWYVFNAPEKLPPIDEATQALFDQGHEVGEYSKKLYPDGIEIPRDYDSIEKTRHLLKERVPLFEASFYHKNTYCKADILVPVGKDEWDLYEVKSSSSLKEEHIPDIAFQLYCIQGSDVKIRRTYLMHINNEYVRKGDIEPKKLFAVEDTADKVSEVLPTIESLVSGMLKVIQSPKEPEPELGTECLDPSECPVCLGDLPKHNVTELYCFGKKAYPLLNHGTVLIKDVPDNDLNEKQLIEKNTVVTKKPHIEPKPIKKFLEKLNYPLYLLDFETVNPAIPLFDDSSPYQQVPFQFSLHILQKQDGKPEHVEFLADSPNDPRPEVVEALRAIGPKGTVLAYNMSFERRVLEDLLEVFPKEKWLQSVIDRLEDLIVPFRSFSYYDPKQQGSCSLKAVLPALTGKGYAHLEISQGDDAARKFLETTYKNKKISKEDKASMRRALLEYCSQDTSAMIDILKVLEKVT